MIIRRFYILLTLTIHYALNLNDLLKMIIILLWKTLSLYLLPSVEWSQEDEDDFFTNSLYFTLVCINKLMMNWVSCVDSHQWWNCALWGAKSDTKSEMMKRENKDEEGKKQPFLPASSGGEWVWGQWSQKKKLR